ncbi:MAG TPA: trypsin-like peptidase domain-containing protein [Nitrosopumilaceae archaeon]|nr:trypsin-like peptidase domain-containing protein [Nitrosopumilaceae archaeon]
MEKLSESVVSISSTRLAGSYNRGVVPVEGEGSGVIIDPSGYIITNNHVIDRAAKVKIFLKDGRSFLGQVMGGDDSTDVALIKIRADDLPTAVLANSDELKVGQIALAIGNALGLDGGHTVSAGVVSALGRPLPGSDLIFEGLIQTDAAINPGNSGGALANIKGEVIGINTAIIPFAQGVGFAIPINTVKRICDQIKENGRVIRPWLGIYGTNLDSSLSKRFEISQKDGILVVRIFPDSPAYEAGLRVGDIIIMIDNFQIKNMKDLLKVLANLSIGSEAKISILRMGTSYNVILQIEETPKKSNRRLLRVD